ncbi:hypothetical protein O181_109425 [Austropuccinia psidii MF-1]|uniref:Uncharacterized protein n=1 Tax=Austropuccinia psidii MF-1 TaxID=1389203 RepID=A0A9Q3JYF4_9BASI|nr:hypothetical protein [Austropuccinia psidii MF-1]
MSLKAQSHFKTICNVWVITPHDARQKLGMLIFVHEKISTPPPAHLTPLPCLLSCMNWLLHPRLIFTKPQHAYMPTPPKDMPPWPPPISALTTPYASTPLLLKMLTLPQHPQYMPLRQPLSLLMPAPLRHLPSLCLCSALLRCLQCHPHTGLISSAT